MAARSIASLTLTFGQVSIPVRLYSATESSASLRFNLLAKDGSRLKQQYVSEKDRKVVPREDMVKGFEVEKDTFVLFTPDELKKLEEAGSKDIEIVAFIPQKAVDPIFYDKAYLLAPDKRGGKPYALLVEAMRQSSRCALAKWAWKSKQYVVQVRAVEDGLVLQQLLYADEVRSLRDLGIEKVDVSKGELQLALQLIDQISEEGYDPARFEDAEKKRILAAIEAKVAGREAIESAHDKAPTGGQVIDLMEALRASIGRRPAADARAAGQRAARVEQRPAAKVAGASAMPEARERKEARRSDRSGASPGEAGSKARSAPAGAPRSGSGAARASR